MARRARLTILAIATAVLLTGVGTGVAHPTAVDGAAPNATSTGGDAAAIGPQITVSTVAVEAGSTTTATVQLSSVPEGLSGFAITLGAEDGTVASVTNASAGAAFGVSNVSVEDGVATIAAADTEDAVQAGASGITLGTVTVEGTRAGETNLSVSVRAIDDDDGAPLSTRTVAGRLAVVEDGQSTPVITSADRTVEPNTTATVDLTLSDAPDGLSGYALVIDTGGDATLADASVDPAFGETNVSIDDGSARLAAVDTDETVQSGATDITLGSVSLNVGERGETTLSPRLLRVDDDSGNAVAALASSGTVAVNTSSDGTEEYVLPGASSPATNLDDDPVLEDVDGDGQGSLFDALAYYNNRNSDVIQDNPERFDVDGDGEAGTIFDALALYNEVS